MIRPRGSRVIWVVCLVTVGCQAYWPIRWPGSHLWTPSERPPYQIQRPSADIAEDAHPVEQQGVTVVAELIDAEQSEAIFGTNLPKAGIQPLRVVIHNGSDQPYEFRQSQSGLRTIPAATVARSMFPQPLVTGARFVRWGLFVGPGIVFSSIIEPATQLEFPGITEASAYPGLPDRRQIRAEYAATEMADAVIPPGSTHAGWLFVRPVKLGRPLSLSVIDAQTQQPLSFELPTPPPVYSRIEAYPHPVETVWSSAVTLVEETRGWKIRSADASQNLITIQQGLKLLPWTFATSNITVQSIDPDRTQLAFHTGLRGSTSRVYQQHDPRVDELFDALAAQLIPQVPPQEGDDD